MVRTLTVGIALALMLASSAFGTQTAVQVWNQHAGAHGFELYPQGSGETFAQSYGGSNIAADFDDMVRIINGTLGTTLNPSEDDLMNARLESWPQGGGL